MSQPKLDCIIETVHKPLKEKGEDALAYDFERGDILTQAVFDGCGGAGSWQYAEYRNATGALISAHEIAKNYLAWFRSLPADAPADPEKTAESFRDMAGKVLTALKAKCAPMKVSGTMVKAFPCTASAAIITGDEKGINLLAMNVGDSRIYYLTPSEGLVQITLDDSAGNPDPMESLRDSAPLSDMLNADNPFSVKFTPLRLEAPCAVICASDGVFGYLRSPMDFEFLLLDQLMRAKTFAEFESAFGAKIAAVTGDDSTCLMSFFGWGSLEEVQRLMKPRHGYLAPMIAALDAEPSMEKTDEMLDQIWAEYRKTTLLYETDQNKKTASV